MPKIPDILNGYYCVLNRATLAHFPMSEVLSTSVAILSVMLCSMLSDREREMVHNRLDIGDILGVCPTP